MKNLVLVLELVSFVLALGDTTNTSTTTATTVYNAKGELNLNLSCPQSNCIVTGLTITFTEPLKFANISAPQVQELLFQNSGIRTVPVEALRLVPNLKSFLMYDCSVNRLNIEDFARNGQLQRLVLHRNHINRLTDNLFSRLPNLQVLELGHNTIHSVQQHSFLGLRKLTLLGLQGNGIQTLARGVFTPLVNLTHLDLSRNEIEELHANSFIDNVHLETLLLNGNRFISVAPESLSSLPRLRLLDLSNCMGLSEVRVRSVDTLVIEGSGLQRLVIDGSVIRLLAGNNALTQLSITDKRAITELDIHGNLLNDVDQLIDQMWNLQRLDLSKNNIGQIRAAVNGSVYLTLPSLTHLNLASNQLHSMESVSLILLSRLLQLDLSFNHLLPITAQTFEPLISLERLYIEGNRLHNFDYETFYRQHGALKELGLCDNDWEFGFIHKMVTYLSDRGVHLPARFVRRQEDTIGSLTSHLSHWCLPSPSVPVQPNISGIHPYWTARDIISLVILLAVLAVLLLLLHHILGEEGCLDRWRSCLCCHRDDRRDGSTEQNGTRPRRLNEEDSETSD